jgi:hypothetical protein
LHGSQSRRRWESKVSWTDLLGYAASAMVLATFCMSSMLYLRLVAIGSNILFCSDR